jgi:hypothetical protein
MTTYTRQFGALFSLTFVVAAAVGEHVQILRVGGWHGHEVKVEAGPDWWGIFPEGDGYTLQSAPVTMTIAHDAIMDGVGEMTGKRVTVPQETAPVLLIRGLEKPSQGMIRCPVKISPNSFLYPGQSAYLALPDAEQPGHLRLAAFGVAIEQPGRSTTAIQTYKLKIYTGHSSKSKTQTIATIPEIGGDGRPRLEWAGDLDRDGKIDLLYDLTDHYNVTRLTLFLSSGAKAGEIVGKVAEWVTTGC